MIYNLKHIPKYIQYIFVFLFSFIIMTIFSSVNAYAATVQKPELISSPGYISSSTCNSWLRDGQSCKVSVTYNAGAGSKCRGGTVSINFTSNTKKSGSISYQGDPNIGTGSPSNCSFEATVAVFNFDDTPPYFDSSWLYVTSGLCDSSEVPAARRGNMMTGSNTITCAGKVTFKSDKLFDSHSGPSSDYVTKTCSPGGICVLYGVDKVGNSSDPGVSDVSQRPLYVEVLKDNIKPRVNTTISGGTKYNGYYVDRVTCTAKCTSDNLACGGTKYTTVDGNAKQCCATAYDKAGNPASDCVDIKRDYNPPTCSQQSINSDALINNYRMGTVTVSWK